MFDVGFAELFLLALIGLIVLGPERLPAVARTLGGFVRKARASWVSLRNTIETELADADITAPIKEASEELRRIGKDMSSGIPDLPDLGDLSLQPTEPTATPPSTEPEPAQEEKPATNGKGNDNNA